MSGSASRASAVPSREAFFAARESIRARSLLTALAIFLVSTAWSSCSGSARKEVLSQQITPGRLGQFILYAVLASSALGSLSETGGEVAAASGAAERLFEILSIKPAILRPARPLALPMPPRGEAAFEDVRFLYPTRQNAPALNGVSFRLRPGEKLAIVGPSGAGKSTIFHLLLRFYDPTAGRITFDGVTLTDLDPADLRARIALVPQDSVMFASSVRDNIRFGRPDASDAEVARAAELANAAGFIAALPHGFDTQVGERGITLSGGQRQRIAIARAILRDAPLLLLDEATSSLDAESENTSCRSARRSDARSHHDRHRASPGDGAVMRPHPGDERRPHRRRGHASDARRRQRPLCAARQAAIPGRLIARSVHAS